MDNVNFRAKNFRESSFHTPCDIVTPAEGEGRECGFISTHLKKKRGQSMNGVVLENHLSAYQRRSCPENAAHEVRIRSFNTTISCFVLPSPHL